MANPERERESSENLLSTVPPPSFMGGWKEGKVWNDAERGIITFLKRMRPRQIAFKP
jgi:hypothetical protein